MKRRAFLKSGMALMLGSWLALPANLFARVSVPAQNKHLKLLFALTAELNIPHIAELGKHYLSEHPEESDSAWLKHNLLMKGPAVIEVVKQAFKTRVQQEFERGELVFVQGWIISRTEARLCALYHICICFKESKNG